jgi:hypothetical protein
LGHFSNDSEDELATGESCVDPFSRADEIHAQPAEFLKRCYKVLEGTRKAVKFPDQDNVQPPPAAIGEQFIESRSAFFSSRETAIGVHSMYKPTALSCVPPQFSLLS